MSEASSADHLPHYRVRPRFKIQVPLKPQEVAGKFKAALDGDQASCLGRVYPTSVRLFLPYEERHYWSPQLSLTFEEEENGTTLRGLYGPRPTVWTMFVFFYAIIGLGVLVVGMIGLSYISLGKPGTILWWVPVMLVVFLTLYLVAYFGQKLGRKQMITLHRFAEKSLGMTIEQ